MNNLTKSLSIVIPIFNEKNIIKKNLKEVEEYLNVKCIEYEIVLVNDGSNDGTKQIVEEYIKNRTNIKLLNNNYNIGKGAAIKKGVLNSSKNYILFMDADLSTPIGEVDKFIDLLNGDNDILIGIRNSHISEAKIERPLIRKIISRLYNIIVNFLFNLQLYDVSCGFKCFSFSSSRILFKKQLIGGWNFDVEIMLMARKKKLRIKEIPVSWTNHLPSRVNIIKDSICSLVNIAKIYFYDLFNEYD